MLDHWREKKNPQTPYWDDLNFHEACCVIRDIIKLRFPSPSDRKRLKWLAPFLSTLRKMEDKFNEYVARDPAILYRPQHEVALAFHKSRARIRYNRSANRTSKTQSGFLEHYWVATGQHPYLPFPKPPTATAIIGMNFSQFGTNVFDKKFIKGETSNPLSPLFPDGGKWLNHYDPRKHLITIACPDCAEMGRAKECLHPKSTISLFSDEGGPDVFQGAQYNLVHFDEHVSEEFFNEAMERTGSVPYGNLILTATPLMGKGSWEYQKLETVYIEGGEANKIPGSDRPLVSIHSIDQYTAGLIDHKDIDAKRKILDPLEQESRIFGRPAPLAKFSVFDRWALHEMEGKTRDPERGELRSEAPMHGDISFVEVPDGSLRLWERPKPGKQYIIGCDVAAGLTNRDFSCATVLELPSLKMVAQLHGWIPPFEYAAQTACLGRWYNMAMVVVERTGGLGVGMIAEMKRLAYWRLFRDLSDQSATDFIPDALYGVDTNMRSKSHMVGCLQKVIKDRDIDIPCASTIEELRGFGQEYTPQKLNIRLRGERGTHDDRVMSLVFGVYVFLSYPVYSWEAEADAAKKQKSQFWQDVDKDLNTTTKSDRDLVFGL